ncbi:B-cadherin-like [Echeneis naucrates]|uniref:B-cadherin-like n=1 Tax=Echeneis naucrates TaxID=173247 RepID=A0A665VMM5_ECHNA|nr:B-cadherin-like [Echeneis naucrates]
MGTIPVCVLMLLCLGADGLSSEVIRRQKRNWIIDSFTIDEGYSGTYPYTLDKVNVEKTFPVFKIRGQGVDEEPKGILKIDSETGEITIHGPVDYESHKVIKLVFLALDKYSHEIDTRLGIEIQIIDANDNAPKFDYDVYEVTVKESTLQGTVLTTIRATDLDSGNNQIFTFRLVSFSPKSDELEFFLTQDSQSGTGTISFKGCLNHEKAEKYTIIVEAKDHGEKVQLSSSCTIIVNIEDGNNHPPVITGQTGPGKVKEGQENVLVSRVQVRDEDMKGTAAWRAKYQIYGDTSNSFRITTDRETNEGLLYVNKSLDYEETAMWNITVAVENEIPYFLCKVESRRTTGLWEVSTLGASPISGTTVTGLGVRPSTYQVIVVVQNVNEAPIFDKVNQEVMLYENVESVQELATFTARDPDSSSKDTFVYIKGEDPAGWVTVDPVTGKVTTTHRFDRESAFVNESIYRVTIYAADNGEPPMTSTATLTIHIQDENDNSPFLIETMIDMCHSDGASEAEITAMDLDKDPFSGPFTFVLHRDYGGRWKVEPSQGYTVKLMKENTVHSGLHDLVLKVSDSQGVTAFRNLSVAVCNCLNPKKPNCRSAKFISSRLDGGGVAIIVLTILMLAGCLLLAALISCKRKFNTTLEGGPGQYLKQSNTEEPGTDCKLEFDILKHGDGHHSEEKKILKPPFTQPPIVRVTDLSAYGKSQAGSIFHQGMHLSTSKVAQTSDYFVSQKKNLAEQNFSRSNSLRWSQRTASNINMRVNALQRESMRQSFRGNWRTHFHHMNSKIHCETLLKALNQKLYSLQAAGAELCDYTPHVYAEEGEMWDSDELDAISIPDTSFDPDSYLNLDYKFHTLASICMPRESQFYRTETSYMTEEHQTLVQTTTVGESHENECGKMFVNHSSFEF